MIREIETPKQSKSALFRSTMLRFSICGVCLTLLRTKLAFYRTGIYPKAFLMFCTSLFTYICERGGAEFRDGVHRKWDFSQRRLVFRVAIVSGSTAACVSAYVKSVFRMTGAVRGMEPDTLRTRSLHRSCCTANTARCSLSVP